MVSSGLEAAVRDEDPARGWRGTLDGGGVRALAVVVVGRWLGAVVLGAVVGKGRKVEVVVKLVEESRGRRRRRRGRRSGGGGGKGDGRPWLRGLSDP